MSQTKIKSRLTIKIEPLQKNDIEEILKIQTENNLGRWQQQDYFDEIQREDSLSFAAKKDKIILGFAVARPITSKTNNNNNNQNSNTQIKSELELEIEIYNLAVGEKHRKKGIGTLLIQKIIQTGVKRQASSIWLEVRESNSAAISLYRKNKFKEIYRRRNFYSHPQEDASVMKFDFFEGNRSSEK